MNGCTVAYYNGAIKRRDGTGRGCRRGHGDVWKKNRVTANGGGVVETRSYILSLLLLYIIYGNRCAAPTLFKQNKRLSRQSLARAIRRYTNVQNYIL